MIMNEFRAPTGSFHGSTSWIMVQSAHSSHSRHAHMSAGIRAPPEMILTARLTIRLLSWA
jgi:hypothetical protein